MSGKCSTIQSGDTMTNPKIKKKVRKFSVNVYTCPVCKYEHSRYRDALRCSKTEVYPCVDDRHNPVKLGDFVYRGSNHNGLDGVCQITRIFVKGHEHRFDVVNVLGEKTDNLGSNHFVKIENEEIEKLKKFIKISESNSEW